ncbi:MAG: hypothetical protein Q4Q53_03400 [Methanocorpusculum sp.]|nr:hypothetical protein [Methanocorpusculum sp.]
MLNEIKLLTKVNICNSFGINEARFSKDKKKRRNVIIYGSAFLFLALIIMLYTAVLSAVLIMENASEAVPMFIFIIATAIIFIFSVFKSGRALFNMKTYEREIVLPVKPLAIVISRLLSMYIFNALLAAIIAVPGSIIYAVFTAPGLSFYITMILGIFLIPLLPMTIATALGAVVLAAASKMKHKNFAAIILSMIFTVLVIALSLSFSFSGNSIISNISEISSAIITQAENIYPPSVLFYNGVFGDAFAYAMFAVISVGIFAVFTAIVQWKFTAVCSALNTSASKKDYVMHELSKTSQLKALYIKEFRRYLASNIYVMNTSIGYVLMVILSVMILIFGAEKINGLFGIDRFIETAVPVVLAFMCAFSSTTASAISMEGKQWWIVKSMPVAAKKVFDSKILVNLSVAFPFYLISVIILSIALPMSLAGYAVLIILPLAYIFFISVLGITVNAKLPLLEWENDVMVVKQSGAMIVTMLIGFAAAALPMIFVFAFSGTVQTLSFAVIIAVIIITTAVLYRKNNRIVLKRIE